MKQLLFGLHLPVTGFSSRSSNINIHNNSGSNNKKKNGEKKMQQQSFTREQIFSIASKANASTHHS
jgi:hypothetical protein